MLKEPLSSVLNRTRAVYGVPRSATIDEAVRKMSAHRIGSVLVEEGGRIVGIVTEREVLLGVVERRLDPATAHVEDVMIDDPPAVTPKTSVEEAMSIMTVRRLRQLPVVLDGKLIGLVSIGDLTKWILEENEQLVGFITGTYPG